MLVSIQIQGIENSAVKSHIYIETASSFLPLNPGGLTALYLLMEKQFNKNPPNVRFYRQYEHLAVS